ncbi:putative ribonuclease H-like domain-containing protein [Tanacetum coccineum]
MVPRAVLMKSGLVSVNTARQVNATHSKTTVNATFNWQSTNVITGSRKRTDSVIPRHMTGNMSYLTNYEEIDGGYVTFGGNLKGGQITRKSRTPQENRVAERRNRTLIEATRTMLADSKLPTTFWAEAVNTAFYMQNMSISSGSDCLFDIDILKRTMNYEPIVAGTQSNGFAGTKASDNAGQAKKETEPIKNYILLPLWTVDLPFSQDLKSSHDDGSKPLRDNGKKVDEDPRKESECNDQEMEDNVNNTINVNVASTNKVNAIGRKTSIELPFDLNMPALEDYIDDEDDGAKADMNNLDTRI